MVTTNIRLAQNNPQDAQSFCNLFNRTYNRKIDTEYYKWQFFSNTTPSILAIIEINNEIVGTYGFQTKIINPNNITSCWAIDIIIDKPFRGMGLFNNLFNFAKEQSIRLYKPDVLFIMANERASLIHTNKLNWTLINECPILTQQIECSPTTITTINKSLPNTFPYKKDVNSISHNIQYITWRFIDNPWYKYDILADKEGYVVTKIFQDEGDIVEIRAIDSEKYFRLGINNLLENGISKINSFYNTTNSISTQYKKYFCGEIVSNTKDTSLLMADKWFIQMSDSEMF
jgi:hypothetical protein